MNSNGLFVSVHQEKTPIKDLYVIDNSDKESENRMNNINNSNNSLYVFANQTDSSNEFYILHDSQITNTGISFGNNSNPTPFRISYQDSSGAMLKSIDSITINTPSFIINNVEDSDYNSDDYNFLVIKKNGKVEKGLPFYKNVDNTINRIINDIKNIDLSLNSLQNYIKTVDTSLTSLSNTVTLDKNNTNKILTIIIIICVIFFILLIITCIILYIKLLHTNKQVNGMIADIKTLQEALIELSNQ
jgi:hypothetical protein